MASTKFNIKTLLLSTQDQRLASSIWLRRVCQTTAIVLTATMFVAPVQAQDATWSATPYVQFGVASFHWGTSWTSGSPPGIGGTGFLGPTSWSTSEAGNASVDGFTMLPGAPGFLFTISGNFQIRGAGLITNGGSLELRAKRFFLSSGVLNGNIFFENSSTAGAAAIWADHGSAVFFFDSSNSGQANLSNAGSGLIFFSGSSSASTSTITNSGELSFRTSATAGNAQISNNNFLSFSTSASAGSSNITNYGTAQFDGSSTAAGASILNNRDLYFRDSSTAGNPTDRPTITTTNGGRTFFQNASSGAFSIHDIHAGGLLDISGLSTAGTTAATISGAGSINLGAKSLTVGADGSSSSFSGNIGGNGGSLVKAGAGTLTLTGTNTFSGNFAVNAGAAEVRGGSALDDNVSVDVSVGAGLTITNSEAIGSLAGAGNVAIANSQTLTVGGNNSSTTFSGLLSGNADLVKIGTGIFTLTGNNSFTDGITVAGGTLGLGSNMAAGTGTITTTGSVINYANGIVIANPININSNMTQLQVLAGLATQSGNISETAGPRPLEKIGAGTLVLSGTNSFTGPLNISSGTLDLQGGAALNNNVAVSVQGGASLSVTNGETIGSLSGAGYITIANMQTLTTGGDDTSTTISGVISGDGGLTKDGAGTLTLTGANTYTGDTVVTDSALNVEGSLTSSIAFNGTALTINGAVSSSVAFDGTTLNVNGTVSSDVMVNTGSLSGTGQVGNLTIAVGATHSPGNSIGTQTVNGNYAVAGTLVVEVDDAGNSDRVIVNGGVTLNGSTLKVVELPGTFEKVNFAYTIIENDGQDAVTGNFSTITNDLAFLTPTVITTGGDGNDVVLQLARNGVLFADVAATPNQHAVAGGIEDLNRVPGSNSEGVLNELFGLSAKSARLAYDSLSGEIHASAVHTLLGSSRQVGDLTRNRLWRLATQSAQGSQSGANVTSMGLGMGAVSAQPSYLRGQADVGGRSGPQSVSHQRKFEMWGHGYGDSSEISEDGNGAEIESHTRGLSVGADISVLRAIRFGIVGGYGSSDIDIAERRSSSDVDNGHVGAYAGYFSGSALLNTFVGYTHHDVEAKRQIAFGTLSREALASYQANQVTIASEAAYKLDLGRITILPSAGIRWSHLVTDEFSENGAGALNLRSAGETYQTLDTTIGARLFTTLEAGGAAWTPEVYAGWTHAFGDVDPILNLAFEGGGSFAVAGTVRDRNVFTVGGGLNVDMAEHISSHLSYSASRSNNLTEQSISGGILVRF